MKSVSNIQTPPVPRRYLALWFPFLTTDRLHLERNSLHGAEQDDRPLVVVEKATGVLRIFAIDKRASKLGLTRGLTLADAYARIPDIAVLENDRKADDAFIKHLADLCDRFTPSVALDMPHGLMLDITGCVHFFATEENLLKRLSSALCKVGMSLRACIACTPDAARALARFSQVEVAPIGKVEELVKQLPVGALAGLERESVIALKRAGLKTLGDLSKRPPQVLAARFGQDFVNCLMRTLGQVNARTTTLRPIPPVVVDQHFPEPFTQLEALENILLTLLERAFRVLQEREQGGRVFEASLFRSDGKVRRLKVSTARPSRDINAIMRLYHERFATLADPIDPGFGFDCIRLAVVVSEALSAEQQRLDASNSNDVAVEINAVGDLVDRLVVRFGRDRVLRFETLDTHDADREAQLVPAVVESAMKGSIEAPISVARPLELGQPPLRPLQLFNPPQPIEALAVVPDGTPLRFRWRRVVHDIARAEGPERIEPEWWRSENIAQARDYYRVEDADGRRFWIFRQGFYGQKQQPSRWFLHGMFA